MSKRKHSNMYYLNQYLPKSFCNIYKSTMQYKYWICNQRICLCVLCSSLPSNGVRCTGDIWPVWSFARSAYPEYMWSLGCAASGSTDRFWARLQGVLYQPASQPRSHEPGLQGSHVLPQLDESGHHIRGGLRLVHVQVSNAGNRCWFHFMLIDVLLWWFHHLGRSSIINGLIKYSQFTTCYN